MDATTEAENLLRALIIEHGLERVQSDLAALYPRASHAAYMSACALARNVNNRIQREEQTR